MLIVVFSHFHLTEELDEALHYANGKCIAAKLITALLSSIAYGLTNNGTHYFFIVFVFE